VAALALSPLIVVQPAEAAVPTFPNNVVVFPNRDFVSIEGYAEHAGETATVEVTRAGAVIGSAKGVVSGTDVAFEVNHPGGVCWGAGTGVNVTPDIQAGDVVSITFPDGSHDETTTSSATVTQDMTLDGNTITVVGSVGPDVTHDFMEQRIINPDLVDTEVAKRDIRALPGPLVPAARGGYSSGLEFPTPTTFKATYVFDNASTAAIAAAADLGERAMSWQVQDPDGNRQGLTIAEFGEVGGPGFGGCPAGPGQQDAPTGSFTSVRSADKTSVQVRWTPATPQPGAAAVTGYSVEAIGNTADANGQQVQFGKRTDQNATQTTVSGLDPAETYTVEVRSLTGPKMSEPFTLATGTPPADTTVPTLNLSPAPTAGGVTEANQVTVTSNGQVFFTTDGSPVIVGDLPSDTAKLYTGPIPITGPTTLKVAAFDAAGNTLLAEGDYRPSTAPTVSAPTGLAGTAAQNSVALTWNAAAAAEQVTGYQVNVYDAAGTTKLATQPPVTSVPRQTVSGLTPATTYQFSVQAKNAGGLGPESSKITVKTADQTDRVTITSARWKPGDFRVVGTGDKLGAIVQVFRVNADGTRGAAIQGATGQVVAAAPPGIGDFDIRLRGTTLSTNPGQIMVVSDGGGVAGPFTVRNG
jgi:hypothetical protein